VNGIWVNAHQYVDDDPYNEKAVSDALIGVLNNYSDELNNLTTLTIESSGTAVSEDGTTTVSLTDLSSSVSSLASGMSKVAYTYSVSASVAKMAPLTCSLTGTFKLCSAAFGSTGGKTVVSAPAGMTVQVQGYTGGAVDDNLYSTATTAANGTFTVDKLPAATDLALIVPGFNYEIDTTTYYFSTFSAAWLDGEHASLSNLVIDGQSGGTPFEVGTAVLYAQPTKIIVTANNVGTATENTPLATTGSLTFTFDRAMTSISPAFYSAYTSESDNAPVTEDVSVSWDSGKTTATITASDGKFDGAIKYIVLSGDGADGCTTFEQSVYEVNFDTTIKVSDTNVGIVTETTPLALTDSLTFTFDRAMTVLTPKFYTSSTLAAEVTDAVNVSWDSSKKTATITAVSGKFSSSIAYIVITGEAEDGSIAFSKNAYEVIFNSTVRITASNVGESTILAPLARTTPLTFTFDRAMTDLTVSFTDGTGSVTQEKVLSWSSDYKTATVTPAGGTFSTSIKTVHLDGTAQDGSTKFSQSDYDVNFILFGVQSVSVIDSSAVPTDASTVSVSAARSAVAVTSSQYLALTFNDAIASAAVYIGTADTYGSRSLLSVKAKTKVLYIPFGDAVNTASADLQVWGTVESSNGDTSTCSFGGSNWKLDAYFAYPEYRISSSNLYAVTDAINSTDDATVSTIAPGTAITLTFDKAFASGATASVELYKSAEDTITANSLSASASVSGSTVTITPAANLEAGKYDMSLKVVSGSTTLFTTVNKKFGSTAYESLISAGNYITFTVTDPVIQTGSNYATTTEITCKDAVVLEFDQDVTGYTAILTIKNTTTDTLSYDDELKAQKNAGTYVPAVCTPSSKKMTVTPAGVLQSPDSVYVYVYTSSGTRLTSVYNSVAYFTVTVKADSVDPTEKTPGTVSLTTTTIDASTDLTFSFVPFALAEDGSSSTKYVIEKKTYNSDGVLSDWISTGTSLPVSPLEYSRQESVTVTVSQTAGDYNYGSHTVSYALIASINNMYYCSNVVVVSDVVHPVFSCSTSDLTLAADTEGGTCSVIDADALDTITFTVTSSTTGEIIKGMTVTSSISNNTIEVKNQYTADGTGITVTVTRGTGTFVNGDYIKVSFTDMSGNAAWISKTNTSTDYKIKFE
jgi:methionine-rich copper-binding protein CopC